MKIIKLRLRPVLLLIFPLICLAFILVIVKRFKGIQSKVVEPSGVTSPSYLSPLVKQLSSMEQCREWEQEEQVKKRMMELFRQADKKNIEKIMQLGKLIYIASSYI